MIPQKITEKFDNLELGATKGEFSLSFSREALARPAIWVNKLFTHPVR